MKHYVRNCLHAAGRTMRAALDYLLGLVRQAWAAHRRLLRDNHAYAAAAAAGAATVAGQDEPLDLLAAVAAALLSVYAATRRSVTRW